MPNDSLVPSHQPSFPPLPPQRPSQQALVEGVVPPFYVNKVQLALSVSNTPTHIFLSIQTTPRSRFELGLSLH